MALLVKFYQTFKKESMPIIYKLLWETEEEETFPNSFYEAHLTQISKTDMLYEKKITDTPKNTYTNSFTKKLENQIQQHKK